MVEELSNDSRLRLTQALSTWKEWSPAPQSEPVLISRLGGHTNESYRVSDSDEDWVIRLNSTKSDGGISRGNELLALEAANTMGISPGIAFHTNDLLILEYIEGDKPTVADLPAIGNLFSKIHSTKVNVEPMSLSQHLENCYHTITPDPDISKCFSKFNKVIHPKEFSKVLCHQDLTMDNLIKKNNQLYVIDWEYAHLSDPAYDLAVFSSTTQLNDAQLSTLLDSYTCIEPNLRERIQYYEKFYSLLEILWWFDRGQKLEAQIADLTHKLL